MKLYTKSGENFLPATNEQILAKARVLAESEYVGTKVDLSAPFQTREFLITQFALLEHEVFAVIFLDNRHRVKAFEIMFRGTIDGASVHPREVVKAALKHNAAAVIFAHNHPSGIPTPSMADELITRRLRDALSLVDIRVLDHMIIAGVTSTSFAERGLV